jgi:hypothetical protein
VVGAGGGGLVSGGGSVPVVVVAHPVSAPVSAPGAAPVAPYVVGFGLGEVPGGVVDRAFQQWMGDNGLGSDPSRVRPGSYVVWRELPGTVRIDKGDTAGGLAERFGGTARGIAADSGYRDPDRIPAGGWAVVDGGGLPTGEDLLVNRVGQVGDMIGYLHGNLSAFTPDQVVSRRRQIDVALGYLAGSPDGVRGVGQLVGRVRVLDAAIAQALAPPVAPPVEPPAPSVPPVPSDRHDSGSGVGGGLWVRVVGLGAVLLVLVGGWRYRHLLTGRGRWAHRELRWHIVTVAGPAFGRRSSMVTR